MVAPCPLGVAIRQPACHSWSVTRLKVCCMRDEVEMAAAVGRGAHAVGLVSAMPSGPGVISDDAAARLARACAPGVATFLLTSRVEASAIVAQQTLIRATALQLVDAVGFDVLRELRERLPYTKLVQVLHVADERTVEGARSVAPLVDAILLDSGNPFLAVKELGGTGRTHDWEVSRAVVDAVPVPVFLAGGLTPENVAEAIRRVRPFGVDVCGGVRTDGRLDAAKLARFAAAVSRA
ncbi:MAG: phosphoribosylanthranilate isomerase [Fimbriimonadaceae bacterium]|nr:phosphoribosylanthranilate isomerase [Fimbriimonadaceae bacterium]